MSLFSKLAVGIDLGTTYSAVAYLDETGRPTTLLSAEGDLLTPSVVLFDEGQVVVGKEALKAMATEANQVADCAKLELGRRTFHKVIGGRKYPPEVIEAWILSKLRSDAMERIGDFHQVVITVPAYFDEVRRKATQDAGFMAGLDVLDIINEPTSAAIAYGSLRGFLSSKGTASDAVTVLVYDLGGGTFDVTVMEIKGSDFTTLATDGDVRLGGRDWDQRLTNHVAEEFIREHQVDPREDPNTAARLWRDCEDAKRTLSARTKASVACDYKGSAIRTELTRAVFEEITRDLVDRTRFTTRQTLKAAGLTWKDIDHVLLVGGSSRMPMIRKMLAELSGMEPDTSVAADEAVAHGAAVRAGVVLAQRAGQHPPLSIKNVNSHSLGVVGTDPVSQLRRSAVLIPRNTPLPVTAKRIFKTQKANQKSILVPIVEGESPSPDDCTPIGKCVVRDLPPNLPVDTAIEVMFRYEENGRLAIEVHVGGTNKELMHEITRENSLSQEQLDSWRQYITQGQVERELAIETPGTDNPDSGPPETDPQDTRWA